MERTAQMMKGIIFAACFLFAAVILTVPAVHAVDYTYDELNRLVAVDYKNGQRIEYEYDAGGNILSAPGQLGRLPSPHRSLTRNLLQEIQSR